MNRKLIIDGNAVYEIDENCMLKKRLDTQKDRNIQSKENQKDLPVNPKKRGSE